MFNYFKSRSGSPAISDKKAKAILKTYGILDAKISRATAPPFYATAKRNYIAFESGGRKQELMNGKIVADTPDSWLNESA